MRTMAKVGRKRRPAWEILTVREDCHVATVRRREWPGAGVQVEAWLWKESKGRDAGAWVRNGTGEKERRTDRMGCVLEVVLQGLDEWEVGWWRERMHGFMVGATRKWWGSYLGDHLEWLVRVSASFVSLQSRLSCSEGCTSKSICKHPGMILYDLLLVILWHVNKWVLKCFMIF